MANARKIAVKALVKISKDEAYSNITVNKLFSVYEMSKEDKALASTLIYGVLDRKITIDYILSLYIKKPVKKISPLTLEALRIAVYQLMFTERIPESAAVNESVKIVKSSKESFNASFVNGVLRNIVRNKPSPPSGNTASDLSVRFSCPKWIIEGFIKDYSLEDAIEILKASLETPPVTVRVNTLKTNADKLMDALASEGVTAHKTEAENALNISGTDISELKAFREGLFHIQDKASQITVSQLNLKGGERVLDICSAPGGKAFTMAELMGNEGEIVAFDLYEKRVELIKRGAKRLGINIINADVFDATKPYKKEYFDAVLCDTVCSGLGVLRRKPEIKYKEYADFSELEATQKTILQNAANCLKKGGRMVYSTCTLRRAENEDMIKAFLKENKDFSLVTDHTFMPHTDYTDGFYFALLSKK